MEEFSITIQVRVEEGQLESKVALDSPAWESLQIQEAAVEAMMAEAMRMEMRLQVMKSLGHDSEQVEDTVKAGVEAVARKVARGVVRNELAPFLEVLQEEMTE